MSINERMVGFIKLTGKMRRIASTFVIAVVMMNLLITGALVSLQYASAIEDASSSDLLGKQEDIIEQQSEKLNLAELNPMIDKAKKFTYDEKHIDALSEIEEKRQETVAEPVTRQAETEKSREVQIMSISAGPELNSQGGLLEISKPDTEYSNKKVSITGTNRSNLERLVMGEAGGEGFEGACLVAQAIKDTMLLEDNYDVKWIKKEYKYSATFNKEPNEDVINAVKFVFDDGGYAVKHRVIYFYAPKYVKNHWSSFHESQEFVIKWGGHKFFDLVERD